MEKDENKNLEEEETYLKLPRAWMFDYLNMKLSLDEMLILIWLSWNANPYNGRTKASYEGIASDLRFTGKNAKNRANKAMLNLKRKRYVWFPDRQGCRGSFLVEIGGYLLNTKFPKDISHHFGKQDRSEEEVSQKKVGVEEEGWTYSADSTEEPPVNEQKSEDKEAEAFAEEMLNQFPAFSRSTNNDSDKNKNINNLNNKSGLLRENQTNFSDDSNASGVTKFVPKTDEERRCKAIAETLEEKSMGFILSRLRILDNDLTLIEEAFEETIKAVHKKGNDAFETKGSYFNKVLEAKIQGARLD